jgi:hypothetical protein
MRSVGVAVLLLALNGCAVAAKMAATTERKIEAAGEAPGPVRADADPQHAPRPHGPGESQP